MSVSKMELALIMLRDEYKLKESELTKLRRRFLADDKEFERIWAIYQRKVQRKGVDSFREILSELLY